MPLQIPKVVQSLFVQSPDAARVRDNMATALQPVLDFLGQYFAPNADGSLSVLRQLIGLNVAGLTVSGLTAAGATIAGDLNVTGNVVVKTRTANGFVIIPAGGSPAFYVTNAGNTAALFIVDASGNLTVQNVTAASLSSAAGIPASLDAGVYWNSSTTAGTYYRTQKVVQNNNGGGVGVTDFIYKFVRAGSIVGYSLNNAGPVTGQNLLGYYKNGTQVAALQVGAGGNNATFWGTHTKGLYPFAAGDTLTVGVGNAAAGNLQDSVQLLLEMGA